MLLNYSVGEDSWESRGLQEVNCNQSILKEIHPKYLLEGLMLKMKLQYFGYLMLRTDSLDKILMLGRLKAGGEGNDGGWDGWVASLAWWTWVWASSEIWWWVGSLACCRPRGHKESYKTERLNWTESRKVVKSKGLRIMMPGMVPAFCSQQSCDLM